MNKLLIEISRRGYRWYLLLKICKALLSVPLFALWALWIVAIAAAVFVSLLLEALLETAACMASGLYEFWGRTKWFSGFSRKRWHYLHVHLKGKEEKTNGGG